MPYRTAAAVTALVTGIWLARRRAYQPQPRWARHSERDLDLQPLPATTDAITSATAHQEATGQVVPLLPEDLPRGKLHLDGPGAPAAARGLLLSAALAAATAPSRTTAVIAIQHDHWRQILADLDLPGPLPGIEIQAIVAPAADASRPSEAGSSTVDARTVLTLADNDRGSVRWSISPEGVATGTGITTPRRLCTLDQQTAAVLLALITRRHRADPTPRRGFASQRSVSTPLATPARLTLIGSCTLTVAGQPVRVRRTAGSQILAYLAVHPDGATRSELITAVWPNLTPASIAQRLHTTISDLRAQLQPTVPDPILRDGDRYRLNPDAIATDLSDWQAVTSTITHAINPISRTNACRRLLDLYQGDLAAGQRWPWVIPARERLRRDALDACVTLADQVQPAEALSWLHRATEIDPYNADIQRLAAEIQRRPR